MLVEAIPYLEKESEPCTQDFRTVVYRFGDARMEIKTDYVLLLRHLDESFSEYEVTSDQEPDVSCEVRTLKNLGLIRLTFRSPENIDAMGFALGQLEHPFGNPYFTEMNFTTDGWRFIARLKTGQPVLAARSNTIVLDRSIVPSFFLVDYLFSTVLSIQKELLFLHAASVRIHDNGILLLGPSGRGKTTLSMALASRGHAFYGDDIASIRKTTLELLPFRRAVSVRSGPRAMALQNLEELTGETEISESGEQKLRFQVRQLFSQSSPDPIITKHAFFLRSFSTKPVVEPFHPSLEYSGWKDLMLNNLLFTYWGVTEEKRLMQFLIFVKLLSKLRCWFLDAGTPDETAEMIESMMEDRCPSQ